MNELMSTEQLIYLFDVAGVAVFAITGALAAQGKKLDILGVVVLGIVTALGGGTIRDITMDVHPVIWIADTTYLWTAIVSAVSAFILCRYLTYPRRLMLLLDALGMSLFAVLGAQKAIALNMPPVIAVMMAMITGCAGGMIRDILTRQIPLILQRNGELYATCAMLGAIVYVAMSGLIEDSMLMMISITVALVVRLASMYTGLELPEFVMKGHKLEPRDVVNTESKKQ
ncbi:trimeric intracellular cation channel family protein [Amphritea balenae]|uniref:Trimeric intracellular cation channel family protein n=2 Tax=Amphritea balenae TaxID=452629 RepID=A0A3P1SKN0_9GAMM|nr:trimeric intracellular cation channel family protein [Amphritea balenae]GGK61066.1 membrane protein [Amphritea balenae]